MAVKIGISGFGRISRVIIRIAVEDPDIEICAINKRNADLEYMKYMLNYDSTFGRFPKPIEIYDEGLILGGKKVKVFSESDASKIPWGACGAEYGERAERGGAARDHTGDHGSRDAQRNAR